MTAISLLRESLKTAHESIETMMAEVTTEVAHSQPEGTAHSIAAIYAHMLAIDDMIIHWLFKNDSPLAMSTHGNRTGMSEPHPQMGANWATEYPEWAKKVKIDLAMIKPYAMAVYASTDEFLASLTDTDLDKELDMTSMGMGKMKYSEVLSGFILGHANNTMGELSVLKGIQGLKGYPF